MQLAGEQCN